MTKTFSVRSNPDSTLSKKLQSDPEVGPDLDSKILKQERSRSLKKWLRPPLVWSSPVLSKTDLSTDQDLILRYPTYLKVGRAYTKTASCGKEFMRHEALRVDLLTLLRSCGIKHWVVKITNMPKR